MKRIFIQTHKPNLFSFKPTENDFIVDEIPKYKEGRGGNYLHLHVKKVNLSTLEMLAIFEEYLNFHNISYAGLKDKYATTTQYISLPASYEKYFEKFRHPQIKILSMFRHHEKLSIGDLNGNRFGIRLHKMTPENASRVEDVLEQIIRQGVPNYFGYQRFGLEENHFEKSKNAARGIKPYKDRRLNKLMSNAYQSYLYNDWLKKRIELCKDLEILSESTMMHKYKLSAEVIAQIKAQSSIFKVLPGDVMLELKSQKLINVKDLQAIKKPYKERKLVPTGMLVGQKVWRARDIAGAIEAPFDDDEVLMAGERRQCWIYPKEIRSNYNKKEQVFELSFTLPKGSYATILLENLANREVESAQDMRKPKQKSILKFDDEDWDED